MNYKSQSNVDKGHFELMEDAKREPYEMKGYTQNTRTQKPKQTLKKIKIKFFQYNNMSMMVGPLNRYLHLSFLFVDLQITTTHLDVTSLPHIHCRFDFD
jgi:hypothetical protein